MFMIFRLESDLVIEKKILERGAFFSKDCLKTFLRARYFSSSGILLKLFCAYLLSLCTYLHPDHDSNYKPEKPQEGQMDSLTQI